jgi:ABC-type phosphate/phosphonate transport system ATPase subunit
VTAPTPQVEALDAVGFAEHVLQRAGSLSGRQLTMVDGRLS